MNRAKDQRIGPPDVAATPPTGLHRRDFLKAAGFALSASAMASCRRGPVEEAIPFLDQPEELVPGRALWYASACSACPAGCGTLVKTRDGRPVKLEGNPDHPLSKGGLCALGQASLLGLYDSHRLDAPLLGGKPSTWSAVDAEVRGRLEQIAVRGGAVRSITGTVVSPTERELLGRFLAGLRKAGADARHVPYDALSSSAIREAHRRTHGAAVLPRYRFDRADLVLSLDADFLGTWISPVEHAAGYRARRRLEEEERGPTLSRHFQLESRMSLTGTNADRREALLPGEIGLAASHLAALVAGRAGVPAGFLAGDLEEPPLDPALLDELADELWSARGRSLVVCGSQDVRVQVLVNRLNNLLGNYGTTVDAERPSRQRQGDDRALAALLDELRAGRVDALLVRGVDPVAELPEGDELARAIGATELSVAFADHPSATADACRLVCPEPHFLETWRDAEPVPGVVVMGQPAVRPLGDTRPLVESLARWSGAATAAPIEARELVRAHWRAQVFPRRLDRTAGFQAFWDRAVHDGVVEVEPAAEDLGPAPDAPFDAAAVEPVAPAERPEAGRFALVLYPKVAIHDGRGAGNPWLQELPDPVTKVTWDNYACLAPAAAHELGVEEGGVVRLALDGHPEILELPVYVQPGQHERTVAVALGYGRRGTERFAGVGPRWIEARPTTEDGGPVGEDVSPWLELSDGALRYQRGGLTVRPAGRERPLATTQRHHRMEVPERIAPPGGERRDVARETTLAALVHEAGHGGDHQGEHPTLWAEHEYEGHRWGMAIDLSACTGCSACVVSCQAENNVPVVGRDEVLRQREMHWLRIDRYYTGGDGGRQPASAVHQPMLCQHCDNAPCETVCPVLATVHSSEGLNQQVYNRCVGTRYCANNCPYKVRRFNWFDYPREDRLENLALNPDVVVRSRGVMEKCSLCIQRIQEQKFEAKRRGVTVADGAIETACQQSCPSDAIVFGDLADPESRVSRLAGSRRAYRLLDELNVEPSMAYLAKVRNREETHHG